jgi:hypothetical protein
VASKIERPARRPLPLDMSGELQGPSSSPRRPPVTNVIVVGQQLAQAFGTAQALINRIPRDPDAAIRDLRRWYDRQHPAERDRLLWQRFLETRSTHARLEHAIRVAREALDAERSSLVQAQAERETLATRPLPATIEEEAAGTRPECVRRYQALGVECKQREAAITHLERLLPAPEQTLGQLPDVIARVLAAVVTVDREAFVRRLRESSELEQLRARLERLRVMANTHEAEINEWSQRVGRPLRVPDIVFPWPPPLVWEALISPSAEPPRPPEGCNSLRVPLLRPFGRDVS